MIMVMDMMIIYDDHGEGYDDHGDGYDDVHWSSLVNKNASSQDNGKSEDGMLGMGGWEKWTASTLKYS